MTIWRQKKGSDDMTDSEKLDLILSEVQGVKTEMQEQKRHTTNIELHLENGTDRNIQLIAENFIELTKKLNQAIPAADKNLAYEVKVNYLAGEVEKLKAELAELKNRIA